MITITKLESYKSRIKVYIDEQIAFVLYKSEIHKYNLSVGMVISEETLEELMSLLYNRGKERALYILDKSYKTEKEITDKLQEGFYPESVIKKIIIYLKEYNLINDLRYASLYIDYKKVNKSKKMIIQELLRKGIAKEYIEQALEMAEFSDEDSLKTIISKRISKYDINDFKSINKLYQYLIGKGYCYSDVKEALSEYINY